MDAGFDVWITFVKGLWNSMVASWCDLPAVERAMLNAWYCELCQWWRMCTSHVKLEDSRSSRKTLVWFAVSSLDKHQNKEGMFKKSVHLQAFSTTGMVDAAVPLFAAVEARTGRTARTLPFQDKGTDWRSYLTLGWQLASRVKHSLFVRCQSSPAISNFFWPRVRKPFLQFIFFPLQQRGCTKQDFLNSWQLNRSFLYQQVEGRW